MKVDKATADFCAEIAHLYDEGWLVIFPDPETGEPRIREKTQDEILAEIENL
jgi:hypothetical protein